MVKSPSYSLQALVLIFAVVLLCLPLLTWPLGADQGEFATIGRAILSGRFPYVDAWNPKPPAIFYIYSLAIQSLGDTVAAVRSLDLWTFPLIALALFRMAQRFSTPRMALMTIACYALMYFSQDFWTLTQNDGLAILPMVLAVLCLFEGRALPAQSRKRWFFAVLCGAFCALTLWFKYSFLPFILALAFAQLINAWRNTSPQRFSALLKDTLAFSVGGLVIGLGGMGYLAANGVFEAWLESALVTTSYTQMGYADIFTSVLWQDSLAHWWPYSLIVLAWALIVPKKGASGEAWWVIGLWLLGALGALLIQAKGYNYHYLPLLPPLALMAAASLEAIRQRLPVLLSRVMPYGLIAFVLVFLLGHFVIPAMPYLTGQQSQLDYYAGFNAGHFRAQDSLAVAEYLKQRTAAQDTLFVWAFRAELYYLADLRPATRFIFQFPLVGEWYPPDWRTENVDTLWAALPPYVVVAQGDYLPWVTGRDEDSKTLMEQDYIDLLHWLQYNYVEDQHIGAFTVYQRAASVP
jgi:hypothetical protein